MRRRRAIAVAAAGAAIWIVGRIAGIPGLDAIGVGILALALFSVLFGRRSGTLIRAKRHLSHARVPAGSTVTVRLDVTNESASGSPFLLLEDRIPEALGRAQRLVLPGIPSRSTQTVSYTLSPRVRGRHQLGPLEIDVSDSFALGRTRFQFRETESLVVTPAIEPLLGIPTAPIGTGRGETAARHLFRTGEEFSAMREYQVGDDLRRIHWPSVARTGSLMIRQDESARRSAACVFLDTRSSALGTAQSPGFEKAVSAAASIGVHLGRSGFGLRLAAGAGPVVPVTEESLLDALAAVTESAGGPLALRPLRARSGTDVTLVAVTGVPGAHEIAALAAAGVAFGRRIAVMVFTVDPAAVEGADRTELRSRASAARLSLVRAGWDVYVLSPTESLGPKWNASQNRPRAVSA